MHYDHTSPRDRVSDRGSGGDDGLGGDSAGVTRIGPAALDWEKTP